MENKDYRKSIGEKLEAALRENDFEDLEDLIEMPSRETFDKWVEEADNRRQVKFRRKRMMSWCAVFVVVFIAAGFAIALKGFAVPQVTADPEQDRTIDNTMETFTTYASWDDLPSDIKEQYFEFTAFLDGYEVVEVSIEELWQFTRVVITATKADERIEIRQTVYEDGSLDSNITASKGNIETWDGTDVVINTYDGTVEEITYHYVKDNILIDITTPKDVTTEEVKFLVKKATH